MLIASFANAAHGGSALLRLSFLLRAAGWHSLCLRLSLLQPFIDAFSRIPPCARIHLCFALRPRRASENLATFELTLRDDRKRSGLRARTVRSWELLLHLSCLLSPFCAFLTLHGPCDAVCLRRGGLTGGLSSLHASAAVGPLADDASMRCCFSSAYVWRRLSARYTAVACSASAVNRCIS